MTRSGQKVCLEKEIIKIVLKYRPQPNYYYYSRPIQSAYQEFILASLASSECKAASERFALISYKSVNSISLSI